MEKRNTSRIIIAVALAIAVLSAAYALRSLATSASAKLFSHSGTEAAYPVQVRLAGVSEDAGRRSAVTRISPRGNETAMVYPFAGPGNVWTQRNEYIESLRIYLSDEASQELDQVVIRIDGRELTTEHPAKSGDWKRVSAEESQLPEDLRFFVSDDGGVFEFDPARVLSSWTVLPPFRGVLNYIGDVQLAAWSVLWAALVLLPALFVRFTHRMPGARNERIMAWVVAGIGFVVLAATLSQFLNPAHPFEAYVDPLALSARALSLSLLLSLFAQRGYAPLELSRTWRFTLQQRTEVLTVIGITALGLALRMLDLDSLPRDDLFNLSSAFSFLDTGNFSYERNVDITTGVATLMEVFGRSVQTAKVPFVIAGTLAIPLVYLLGRFVSPVLGLLAAAIIALDPYQIGVSGYVREYPITLVLALLIALVQFAIYKRLSHRPGVFLPALFGGSALLFLGVFAYSHFANNGTVLSVLQSSALVAVALAMHHVGRQFPRLLLPISAAVAISLLVGFALVHRFGPFTSDLLLRSEFYRAYFNPLADRTMHTFSFAAVSELFIFALTILPFISTRRSPYLDAVLLAFWGTFVLFTLKLTAGQADRYLHHVSAFHAILLSGGIVWLFQRIHQNLSNAPAKWIGLVAIFVVLVNPVNSIQSALNAVPNQADRRTPTYLSGGNFYEEVAAFMREYGVNEHSALIEASANPDHASILLHRRITRTRTNRGRNWKDIGEAIYQIRWNVLQDSIGAPDGATLRRYADQSWEAFRDHDFGFLITDKFRLLPREDFRMKDVDFEYLGAMPHPNDPNTGFVLYRWTVRGPQTPGFTALFDPTVQAYTTTSDTPPTDTEG